VVAARHESGESWRPIKAACSDLLRLRLRPVAGERSDLQAPHTQAGPVEQLGQIIDCFCKIHDFGFAQRIELLMHAFDFEFGFEV